MIASRNSAFDDEEMAAIEADLDELESFLRADRHRRKRGRAANADPPSLRPRPAAFARAVVAGTKPHVAAALAGYRGARMAASRLMKDPRILAEIARLTGGETS